MSVPFQVFLAVADAGHPALPNSTLASGARDALGGVGAVFVASLVVVGLCILWAVFIRKPSADHKRGALTEGGGSHRGGRRRRRSSKERPRNPTLAETGGLPPRGAGDVNAKST